MNNRLHTFPRLAVAASFAAWLGLCATTPEADAQARRGGGAHAAARTSGGHTSAARASAHTSVNRPVMQGGQTGANRAAGADRPAGGRDINRNTNRNVNRNTNINRDIDVDVDVHDDHWNDWDDHPFATAAAVTAGVALTTAVIGSIVYSVPPSCTTVIANGISYSQCGSTWYQPRYSGTTVQYVVVNAPY